MFMLLALATLVQAAQTRSAEVQKYVSVDAPVIAINNVVLIDGNGGIPTRGQTILIERQRIKRQTIANRRLLHRRQAA